MASFFQYKFRFNKVSGGLNKYVAVSDITLHDSPDGTSANFASSGTASTNGFYASNSADRAFDSNPTGTYWESDDRTNSGAFPTGMTVNPAELNIAFSEKKTIRCFSLMTISAYPDEIPVDFDLLGSDDGTTWTLIQSFKNAFTSAEGATRKYFPVGYFLSGVSKLSNGAPSSKVVIWNAATYQLLGTVIPDSAGAWKFADPLPSIGCLVGHVGPSGYRPQIDGPVFSNVLQ